MITYTEITIILIAGSIACCLALAVIGSLLHRRAGVLPPVPLFPGNSFPNFAAQFYTAFFIITFGMASIAGCMEAPIAEAPTPTASDLIWNAAIQFVLYVPFLIIYFSLPCRIVPRISAKQAILWIVTGLALMYLPAQILELAGFTQFLIKLTGCPEQQDVVETLLRGSIEVKVIMLVMAVIIAPVTEECCFRGFVYNILKQKSNPLAAALASAVLFSAVHASLAQFVQLFIFGLVQCYMYEKARSLWLPIVLHVLFNAISSAFLLTM